MPEIEITKINFVSVNMQINLQLMLHWLTYLILKQRVIQNILLPATVLSCIFVSFYQ